MNTLPLWNQPKKDYPELDLPNIEFAIMEDAQHYIRTCAREGVICPCCGQHAKVYKRKLHSGIACDLILFYRWTKRHWKDLPEGWFSAVRVLRENQAITADYAKLVLWGLLEKKDGGLFRLTMKGEGFVEGKVTVPKYVLVYNAKKLGVTEEMVTIREALGDKFNYSELMKA